jgi:hypothetical protein
MGTGSRKTNGNRFPKERLAEGLRWIDTGHAAALAYLNFLRENQRLGTLEDIALDVRRAALDVDQRAY